jgi:hypothetical protein
MSLLLSSGCPIPSPCRPRGKPGITDLDSDEFTVRAKAFEALVTAGQQAEPALRQVLRGQPFAEVKRRATELLNKIRPSELSAEQLRVLRALTALEQISTPAAGAVLEDLSRGAAASWLPREAKASLRRLAPRPSSSP